MEATDQSEKRLNLLGFAEEILGHLALTANSHVSGRDVGRDPVTPI